MTVQHVRVGDVLRLERARINPDPAAKYRQIGIYSWGKGIIENPAITGAELSKVTYYRLPANALVLSNIQAWEAAIAVSTQRHADEFIASQRFLPYVPRTDGDVDARYLLHFFLSDPGMALIRKASPGTVTRNRTLGIKAFEDLVIPLPNLVEQRRIAIRIDRMASSGLGKDGHAAPLRTALREQIVSRSYAYSRVALGELMQSARAWLKLDDDAVYTAIGVRGFGRGLIQYPPVKPSDLSKLRYYSVPSPSLIVSNIKAWEGAVALVSDRDADLIASNRFLCYQPRDSRVSVDFIRRYLLSNEGIATLGRSSPGSADRNRTLSITAFERIEMPVPPAQLQRSIASSLALIDDMEARERRRDVLASALPQAARNEVFSKLI